MSTIRQNTTQNRTTYFISLFLDLSFVLCHFSKSICIPYFHVLDVVYRAGVAAWFNKAVWSVYTDKDHHEDGRNMLRI
jgi:hypothetical protein